MAYAFNNDRSKTDVYRNDEIDDVIDNIVNEKFITSDIQITESGWAFDSEESHFITKAGRICYINFVIERSSAQTINSGAKLVIGRVPNEFIPFKEFSEEIKIIKHNPSSASDWLNAEQGIDNEGYIFIKNWGQSAGDIDSIALLDFFYVSTN